MPDEFNPKSPASPVDASRLQPLDSSEDESARPDVPPARPTQKLTDLTNNKCPTCGLVNRLGVLVCENCGTSLIAGAASVPSTRSLQDPQLGTGKLGTGHLSPNLVEPEKLPVIQAPAPAVKVAPPTSSGIFDDDMILRLEIVGATIPILVYPKRETLIGRRDVTTGTMPDVDLTSYAGYRMGVSRRHAVLRLHDKRLEIVDLGSSNGSKLNKVLMQPHQPYLLRDGDALELGRMDVRVMFLSGPARSRTS